MNRLMITLTGGLAALAAMAPAAQAAQRAPWQSVNQREYRIVNRINQGVRNRSLNRREAAQLTYRYRQLVTLENRYRRTGGGLSLWERSDLDRRFDALSRSIRTERHDRQRRRW